MGRFIDQAYLIEVVGERALLDVLGARFAPGAAIDLSSAAVTTMVNRAILVAEGIAEGKLGRRFTEVEVAKLAADQSEVLRGAMTRIALYELAPGTMPRSEQLRADYDRACSCLKDIARREMTAGKTDPDRPAVTGESIDPMTAQKLNGWASL